MLATHGEGRRTPASDGADVVTKMCLDCGEVGELEGETHHLCPRPSRVEPSPLVAVRVEECPVRGSDRRTKRYRDNVCDSEHHHYGRGDHVVILDADEELRERLSDRRTDNQQGEQG